MVRSPNISRSDAGVALLTALAMLILLSLLGAAYLQYSLLSRDSAGLELSQTRARLAAQAGVSAANAEIGAALQKNIPPKDMLTVALPLYAQDKSSALGFTASDQYESHVKVTVADECAKVNLNHAPTRILEALLGVNATTARAIRASLPRMPGESDQPNAQGKWLTSLDDLVTRGLIDADTYAKVDKSLVTVYTVANPMAPAQYINLNTAKPDVLAAVLNISKDAATVLATKRPFASLADLVAKTGTDPATFNIPPDPATPGELPSALTLQSRCYRVVSEAELATKDGGNGPRGGKGRVEAVVLFNANTMPEFRYWHEGEPQSAPVNAPQDKA